MTAAWIAKKEKNGPLGGEGKLSPNREVVLTKSRRASRVDFIALTAAARLSRVPDRGEAGPGVSPTGGVGDGEEERSSLTSKVGSPGMVVGDSSDFG